MSSIEPTTKRARVRCQLPVEPIFVDLATAAASVSLSEPTWQRLVREEKAPAPRKISDGRVGWLLSEIRAWAAERPVSDLLPPPNTGSRKRLTQPNLNLDQKGTI